MAASAMAVVVIDCAAAVDATTNTVLLLMMPAVKMPSLLLPLTVTAVDNDHRYCHCRRQTTTDFWRLSSLTVALAMVVMDGGNSCHRRQQW